ncbi:portal protein [Vibrio phage 1.028.O._10N.286.45.B6]|nr:portal protein [Vibrio phage 1.028.O._10N.286.45.B6]AUR90032.1 portal protein [Vibrio phage 1.136.O._10N.261.45.E11]AUR90350.1 portal protein [Vibrio phage 1.142.O._10N.261.49.E11]AUR91146.1 portal protein [Vibrio phage 1.156.O._10N.261.45.A6]AUR91327.1 portal protein [Vibrio phage 1.159.O._10N.261.46.F12]AUR96225.1 portal protein [Vibrio phage 1.217.O._10N.261.45.A1]AUR96275.1 portal protein [Vibrio phage 1.219.O._10N.261.45.E2]AUS02509.1 portal protein [Vibrio phage 2.159.A._10N.261.46.
MTQIVDVNGQPLKADKTLLSEDIAKAYTTSVRNPRPASVASTLNPLRLAGLLRSVVDGNNPQDYMTLAEEMEERDLHYAAQLRTRKLAVAAIEPTVEPASDEQVDLDMADRVRDIMAEDQIPELFFDLLDGLGKGLAVVQVLWDTKQTPWKPQDYKWVDPRYLRADQDTLEDILLISDSAPSGEPLEPYKFMVHTPRSKSGIVWRNGLARLVAVMYMLKSFTVRDWWAFAEVFGIPVRVGKYGPNASAEDINTLVNAIGRIASDAGAAIPESMKLELIETAKGNGGETLFENMARWCDEQTSKAVLGQTMTADNGSSQSQANVHNEVRMDIAKWDARQLEACVNEYLVKPYVILNWGVQERYPKVRIRVPEPEDLKMLVDSLKPMIESGMRVSASEVREKFGLREPTDDEDVLMPASAVLAQNRPATNRDKSKVAINRISKTAEAEMNDLTDEAMSDWEEVAEDFINPIIELANASDSYETFLEKLPELQETLGADVFVEQMAQYMFQMRGYGDAKDV